VRPAALPSKKRLTDKERRTINRQNGKKSRGAKTPLGRSRSSQNALRHGLAVAISDDPTVSAAVEHLAVRFAGDTTDPNRTAICRHLAEAQLDLFRIRNARIDIWADGALRKVKTTRKELVAISRHYRAQILSVTNYIDSFILMDECEHALLTINSEPLPYERGVGLLISRLHTLERYEKRALSKRNGALRDLAEYDERKASGLTWP